MFLAQFEHFKLPDAADVHLRQTNPDGLRRCSCSPVLPALELHAAERLHLSSHSRLPLRVELDRPQVPQPSESSERQEEEKLLEQSGHCPMSTCLPKADQLLLLREKTGHHCFIVLDGLAPGGTLQTL